VNKTELLILLAGMTITLSCNHDKTGTSDNKTNKLAGTWRLIEYSDFDSLSGKWIHPYGEHPKGYFTYTNSGIVNLNISAENPLYISEALYLTIMI
jgi:hypothetical protein